MEAYFSDLERYEKVVTEHGVSKKYAGKINRWFSKRVGRIRGESISGEHIYIKYVTPFVEALIVIKGEKKDRVYGVEFAFLGDMNLEKLEMKMMED
jgi:hypothetical protein